MTVILTFYQFKFQNGHFVSCSISGVVTTGKIRKLSKPAKLQSIVYKYVKVSHKQLIVTLPG